MVAFKNVSGLEPVQARCPGHISQLSVEDSKLVGFVNLLAVNERDNGVVVLKPILGWNRFKHAVLGTHFSCLGCLFRTVT